MGFFFFHSKQWHLWRFARQEVISVVMEEHALFSIQQIATIMSAGNFWSLGVKVMIMKDMLFDFVLPGYRESKLLSSK